MSVEWNGEAYHRVSEPQFRWGVEVLSSLELQGDETVLDAGCGSGRLTAKLLERLPRGKVIALDASRQMLEVARREVADPRVEFMQADLGALTLNGIADVVFSTATFHWVFDHAALFAGLRRALRPGGRLHAQCGGAGNLAHFVASAATIAEQPQFRAHLAGFAYPAHFATAERSEALLKAEGFTHVTCGLKPAPTPFASAEAFREFIGIVVLRHQLARLPEELRGPFLDQVTRANAPHHSLDYVRLELRATG